MEHYLKIEHNRFEHDCYRDIREKVSKSSLGKKIHVWKEMNFESLHRQRFSKSNHLSNLLKIIFKLDSYLVLPSLFYSIVIYPVAQVIYDTSLSLTHVLYIINFS